MCAAKLVAQDPAPNQAARKLSDLPDAPLPQIAEAEQAQQPAQQPAQNTSPDTQKGTQPGSQQGSSAQQPDQRSQYDKAQEQIKKQESQRALWVIPAFNTTYTKDVVPLTKGQKMKLALRSSVDPFTFAQAALFGGYRELGSGYSAYGWGVSGYAKRAGSAYADTFIGNIVGNGLLPGMLHQDPRYFRLGQGSAGHRALYAAFSALRCHHDGSERWEPNYSNVIGNIVAGAISNVYYPQDQRGWGHTFGDGLVNTATGMIGSEIQEFSYDLVRKIHRHKAGPKADEGQPASEQVKPDQPKPQPPQ